MRAPRFSFPRSLDFDAYHGRRGVRAEAITRAVWRKSSFSDLNGDCFEAARLSDDRVGVRDTKDSGFGPVLVFNNREWDAFIKGAKHGEFDSI